MTSSSHDFDIELKLLLEGVFLKYQHDFRHYAISSLRRRVRQAMERFHCATVTQLQERVLHEPDDHANDLRCRLSGTTTRRSSEANHQASAAWFRDG